MQILSVFILTFVRYYEICVQASYPRNILRTLAALKSTKITLASNTFIASKYFLITNNIYQKVCKKIFFGAVQHTKVRQREDFLVRQREDFLVHI
jgi:hypothetical protein